MFRQVTVAELNEVSERKKTNQVCVHIANPCNLLGTVTFLLLINTNNNSAYKKH